MHNALLKIKMPKSVKYPLKLHNKDTQYNVENENTQINKIIPIKIAQERHTIQ